MISIRMFDYAKDAVWFRAWHEAFGAIVPPECFLPAVGSVVERDKVPLAAGFLYLATDCPVAVIEWVTVNPDATPEDKHLAVLHVLQSLKETAIAEKHPAVMLYAQRSIAKVSGRAGFAMVDPELCLTIAKPEA